MKRKTIKAKLTAALSASMALAMLAPATPAYAAAGTLKFDFHTNASTSLAGTPEITVTGNVGDAIPAAYNLQNFGGRTGLPWQTGITTTGTPVAEFGNYATTTVNGQSWAALGLDGYIIKEFRGGVGLADFPRAGLDVGTIQNQTYYATLGSDGTTPMNITEQHEAASGTAYVPSLPAQGPKHGPHKVLESIQTIPYVIPGYKVVNATITGAGSAKALQYMGGSIPSSNFISFITSNKDVDIKYEYAINPDKKFTVKVVDKVWQNDSATPGTFTHTSNTVKGQNSRTSNNVTGQVLTNITGITANPNYVDTTGTATLPSRYVLDPNEPVTITYDNGEPSATTGEFSSSGSVIKTLIPAKTTAGLYTAISAGTDAAKTISGQIPNQNVTITYNYYENPNYYTLVSVKYVDKEGNDITSKVVDEHPALFTDISTVTSPVTGTVYKDGSSIFMRVTNAQANYNVPVPVMNDYISTGNDRPSIAPDNTIDWSSSYRFVSTNSSTAPTPGQESWGAAHQYYTITVDKDGDGNADTPTKNGELTVTYTVDPNKVATVAVIHVGNGQLIADRGLATEHEYGTEATDTVQLSRENVAAGTGDYSLTINASDLPTPVPQAGYTFTGWKYEGTTVTLPHTVNSIPGTQNSIVISANFEQDPNQWNTYNLVAGDSHVTLLGGSTAQVANTDASTGLPRATIPFSDIDAFTQVSTGGVSVDPGYTLEWHDQAGNVLTPGTDISGMNGQTFTAFAISTTPAAVYTPVVTGDLDSSGVPTIAVDPLTPAAMDARLNYVVTDASGNVVAIVPGSQVIANGGNITGNFLTPGNTYNIATALNTAALTVGSPIPAGATDVSATSPSTIPVAPTPQVTEDSANPGRASITIDPTAPNTEYALIDDNGNEVYPFTTPSGNRIVFGNLDPNRTYHVVPRQVGSTDTPAQRQAAGADLPVSTNNLGLTVNTFDVTVVANNAPNPIQFKINGVQSTNINVLQGLAPGTQVQITAAPLDNASNTFSKWKAVSGITINPADETNALLVFTMPNGPVKIQAMYDDGTNWDNNLYTDHIGSGKTIGSVNPVINDTGRFRVVINKNSVPTSIKNVVADTLTDPYNAVFLMDIVVQKFNNATGNWEDYVPATGDISLDTTVETGALMSTRDYMFHELATSSNAATALSGDFENPGSTYPGQFDIQLTSGRRYVFGYTTPSIYRIKIKDNRDNTLITSLTLRSTETVQDKASLYSGSITGDYIDNNGITWHYEGLSTDKDTYQAYDPTLRVTSDETLYVFYSNDKVERARAERDLKSAVNDARRNMRNYDANSQGLLTSQLAAAQAILDRINRKSSTAELQAALDALNNLLATLTPRRTGGGGGRGGSGGGSGNASRRSSGYTAGLRVGYDGNWELTNPVEATANPDSSKWVFNLANGTRAKGWAYLSYTYEGKTKSEWYHFAEDGIMDSGWFLDGSTWYYLSMNHNGFFGEMIKGWHHDGQDGRWYYLDPSSGAMHTNWSKINGEFYFLNPTAPAQTWFFDNATGRWNFGNISSRPYGSMYQNENTPDGYHVNESGAWR